MRASNHQRRNEKKNYSHLRSRICVVVKKANWHLCLNNFFLLFRWKEWKWVSVKIENRLRQQNDHHEDSDMRRKMRVENFVPLFLTAAECIKLLAPLCNWSAAAKWKMFKILSGSNWKREIFSSFFKLRGQKVEKVKTQKLEKRRFRSEQNNVKEKNIASR